METSKGERNGYYSYFVGQNIIFMFVTMFLSLYYTNYLGIPAAIVGNILLFARVFDAINDPIVSIFVEKANIKGGKFLPWIKSVTILMPISTVLIFLFQDNLSGSSLPIRVLYATVTYIIWGLIYTISDAPAWAMATVMTNNVEEREKIMSFSKLTGMVGIILAMTIGNMILVKTNNNWLMTAVSISAAALVFLLPVRKVKERVNAKTKSPTLMEILKSIICNKYLVIFVICIIFSNGTNFSMTLTPFVAAEVFKDPAAVSIISLISFIPTIVIVPIIPMLIKKVGKRNLFLFSLIWTAVLSVVQYFAGYSNMAVFYILSAVKGIGMGPILIISALFFADCVEYYYYTKGDRFEAAIFAAQTFSSKVISAMAGALGMFLLSVVGYVSSTAGETVVQSQQTVSGMWTIYILGPAVGSIIAAFIFGVFYKLKDEDIKMMTKANIEKLSVVRKSEEGTLNL